MYNDNFYNMLKLFIEKLYKIIIMSIMAFCTNKKRFIAF
nr:MAG TPA: hypothetical protein [Caudoviricetes sp.]